MKKYLAAAMLLVSAGVFPSVSFAQFGGILGHVQDEIEKKTDEAIDKAMSPEDSAAQAQAAASANQSSTNGQSNSTSSGVSTGSTSSAIAAYQNYDFKPGEKIIFEDDFTADQDGEFPAHWNLDNGQAVVNKVEGESAFLLTDGNYALVSPRMKTASYLTDPFTVEFDYFQASSGQWAPLIRFYDADAQTHDLNFGKDVTTSGFPHDLNGVPFGEDYFGKWHHAALIYKGGQLKAYVDNTRALVMPHTDFVPTKLSMGGIGQADQPITFKNFRIASGGASNTIGNLLTDGKFITHGITFDIGKATLKPESMGVLNEIATFLKSNSNVKMEIDGHTDSDGDAAKNMTLSQQRANAVKAQLAAMGVDANRLSTKGMGATKPLGPNDTPEGKANNRRVEFVKIK